MSDVRVNLKLAGIARLKKEKRVEADLYARGARVAAAAGSKFVAVSRPHRFGSRVYVWVRAGERYSSRDKDALLRGLSAGSG